MAPPAFCRTCSEPHRPRTISVAADRSNRGDPEFIARHERNARGRKRRLKLSPIRWISNRDHRLSPLPIFDGFGRWVYNSLRSAARLPDGHDGSALKKAKKSERI